MQHNIQHIIYSIVYIRSTYNIICSIICSMRSLICSAYSTTPHGPRAGGLTMPYAWLFVVYANHCLVIIEVFGSSELHAQARYALVMPEMARNN